MVFRLFEALTQLAIELDFNGKHACMGVRKTMRVKRLDVMPGCDPVWRGGSA